MLAIAMVSCGVLTQDFETLQRKYDLTEVECHMLYQRFVTLDRYVRHAIDKEDLAAVQLPPVIQAFFVHGFSPKDKQGRVKFEAVLMFLRIFHKNNDIEPKIKFIFDFMQAFGGGNPDDGILEVDELRAFIKMMEPGSNDEEVAERVRLSLDKMGVKARPTGQQRSNCRICVGFVTLCCWV